MCCVESRVGIVVNRTILWRLTRICSRLEWVERCLCRESLSRSITTMAARETSLKTVNCDCRYGGFW